MAVVKSWQGAVPPDFSDIFELDPGVYSLTQNDPTASFDAVISDANSAQVLAFTESARGRELAVTTEHSQPLTLNIVAYEAGGTFDIFIEESASLAKPADGLVTSLSNDPQPATIVPVEEGTGNTFPPGARMVVTEYSPTWQITLSSDGSFANVAHNAGTECGNTQIKYQMMLDGVYSPEATIYLEIVGCDTPPPDPPVEGDAPQMSYVYETERGWTFDGNYIPHFAEVNWYFGDNPVDYTSVQKVRIHGLSQGRALISMAVNGIQQDGYDELYSEPQWVDLPRNVETVLEELMPKTNYTDTASRGLATQMKFEGRNKDITRPEPGHVLQVLIVQSSPPGTGHRSN